MFNYFIIAAIIVVIAIILIIVISVKSRRHRENKGEQGERLVAEVLGKTVKGKQYVINDILFENQSEQSCQIDHVYINKHGIWVIETKNYSGIIYGQENWHEWTQVLAGGHTKNKFYNPIRQNTTHINRLSKYLEVKDIFNCAVVFLSNADISNIESDKVYSIDTLQSIKTKSTDIHLTAEQMEYYYKKLLELKKSNTVNIKQHVKNIHKMQQKIERGICPCCGKKLELRDGENGKFYGCSNFPRCKFTKKID